MIHPTQKGFTLVEMITVLGIFAVMTSIVVFNYNKFRSDTILTNMAYEVALSIREAQIYGVSVRGGGTSASFGEAYGIYLPFNKSQYVLFIDDNDDEQYEGSGDGCETLASDTCVTPYSLQRNVKISNIKNIINCSSSTPTEGEGVSIVFKRPNPEPVIKGKGLNSEMSQVEITLQSAEGTERYVEVYGNGQIAVLSKSVCDTTP